MEERFWLWKGPLPKISGKTPPGKNASLQGLVSPLGNKVVNEEIFVT